MPSQDYASFTDGEAASIISYLRSVKPQGTESPEMRLGLKVRIALIAGILKPVAGGFADTTTSLDLGPRYERGRHLAEVVCAQCHGKDLRGTPKDLVPAPDLLIVGAYDRCEFRALMRTGKAIGGRDVGEMSKIASGNLSGLTVDEIDATYDYLAARAKAVSSSQNSSSGRYFLPCYLAST